MPLVVHHRMAVGGCITEVVPKLYRSVPELVGDGW